jgi:hypothetical protein
MLGAEDAEVTEEEEEAKEEEEEVTAVEEEEAQSSHFLSSTDAVRTSPVLTKSVGSSVPRGYAVTKNGDVVVFDASGASIIESAWTMTPKPGTGVEAHPAFDCNRRAGAAVSTTGILYVPYIDGTVVAVIVDSARLQDGVGAWPKYQRTSGKAGNDDTTFFPTNWASCP